MGTLMVGSRVGAMRLPDGTERPGTVIAVTEDGGDTLYRIRFDGVYFIHVSECVGGVNPASQYTQWFMEEELSYGSD